MARRTREVTLAEGGERIDAALARATGLSRAQVSRLIEAGDVTIDGHPVSRSMRPQPGTTIVVLLPEEPAPLTAEAIAIRVVYEDEHLLVVSKPAGLVVHPAPGHDRGTLVNALLGMGARGGDPERPGIVHRLDAGTSGLMVVARSQEAYEALVAAMKQRRVSRTYLTVVEGSPDTDSFTVDAPIGRSPTQRKQMGIVAGGKPAQTDATVLERLDGCTLLEVQPRTGRTHQIRVHMRAAGHPVVGDPVYGRDRALAQRLGLARPFLHAARLVFAHPITGRGIDVEDPLPPDLVDALAAARRT